MRPPAPLVSELWLARTLIGLVALVLAWRSWHSLRFALAIAGARRRARVIARQHLPALLRRRAQLVQRDAYGKPVLDRWKQELRYFVGAHVEPGLSAGQRNWLGGSLERLETEVEQVVEAAAEAEGAMAFSEPGAAADYEAFCAAELRRAGWDARVTPPGRDQGADVIAEKDGKRIVLQCKLHNRKIGNRAVQEVVAARAHERACFAAVVSNQAYTASAIELAATNEVLLLHHTQLAAIDGLLSFRVAPKMPAARKDARPARS